MTASPLLLIENQAKADTLGQQLPENLETLLVNGLPIKALHRTGQDAKPEYEFLPLPAGESVIAMLKENLEREIYIAFDSDQRGEYLSWLLSGYITVLSKGNNIPKRLYLFSLNQRDLQESFKWLEPVVGDKPAANYIRSIFNSYLGKHIQRLLGTQAGPGNLPLTYHSLTTLFMIEDREAETRMYAPALKWQIRMKLASGDGDFFIRLEKVTGVTDDGFFLDAATGKEIVAKFKDTPLTVTKIEKSELVIEPSAPLRLVDLMQEAYVRFGIMPKTVLDVLRKLFYGVPVNGHNAGLISSFIPLENGDPGAVVEDLQNYIIDNLGEDKLAEEDDLIEVTEEHILPLRPEIDGESLHQVLSEDERSIYNLIRARALASQMTVAVGENITVEFQAGPDCHFKAVSRSITEQGFLAVYQSPRDKELMDPCPLINLKEGQALRPVQVLPEQTSGFQPEYYTFESLFVDLADFSMDVDPLTFLMFQTMLDNQYMYLTPEGCLRPKENTGKVVATINRAFPTMQGINFSAYLEQTIDEVITGRKTLDFALKQFDQTLMKQGRVLVRVTVADRQSQRPRKSSSIIKTVEEKPALPTSMAEKPVTPEKPVGEAEIGEDRIETLQAEALPVPETRETLESAELPPAGEPVTPEEDRLETVPEKVAGHDVKEMPVAEQVEASVPDEEQSVQVLEEPAGAVEQEHAEETAADEKPGQEAEQVFDGSQVMEQQAAGVEEMGQSVAVAGGAEAGETKPCPDCSRPLLLKNDRFGKYWSCSGFPACRHAEAYEKVEGPQIKCPLCQVGKVQTKLTPTGKTFYVCLEENCEFMAWSEPYPITCQICKSPYLVVKKDSRGQSHLRCPRAGCNYMQPMSGAVASDGVDIPTPKKKRLVRVRRGSGGAVAAAGGKKRMVRVVRRKK